jgi:hypothetical protein
MGRDLRKHKRLAVAEDVTWTIEAQGLSGSGKLVDASLLGAGLQIDGAFTAKGPVLFKLHAPYVPALPARARLRWFRRLSDQPPTFLCGVIFQVAVSLEWSDWIYQAEGRTDDKERDE